MEVYEGLKSVVKGEVKQDKETLKTYSVDTSLFEVEPKVVVFPKDVEDIKALVKYVTEHKAKNPQLSITARSGGTDMSGGPLNESIIIDFTKHINKIKEVTKNPSGDGVGVVEPGAFYRDFEKATAEKKLLMPSYPASKSICAVGGMVANNSGGEKTLTYGKTEDYVSALKMVLSDGEEYEFKPLIKEELDQKINLQSAEGEVYRKLFELLNTNYETIKKAKPNVSKNSAGYFLWNVWDRERQVFDVPKLIVGSQGTLGIITEITFRLIEPKEHSTLLIIFLKDIKKLGDIVGSVLKHKPESFESYDDHTLNVALRFLPDILKTMGATNLVKLAFQFIPEVRMALTGGVPKLFLEAEFTGDSEEEIYKKAYAAEKELKANYKIKTRVTKGRTQEESDLEESKYWTLRRQSFAILRNHVRGKRTAPFIDDIIVRPELLPEFLPRLDKIMDDYDLIYTVAGHVGDGNFHIIPLMNMQDEKSKEIIVELSGRVYKLVKEFEGSISGEHNDGLIRSPFLKQMYGEEVYSMFEQTKNIFDPLNIFNPGKKVYSDFEHSLTHLVSES